MIELKTGEDVMEILGDTTEQRALLVNVWPDAARAFLDINQRNRTVTQSRVNLHADSLRDGRWQLINNGLGVDVNGDLADGQHRLLAIVRADIPGAFWMITGLDPKTREVIDTGRARKMGDTLAMHGYGRGQNQTAAALRLLFKIEHDLISGPHSKEQTTVPHDVLMRWLESSIDWEMLVDCTNVASTTRKNAPGLNTSAYCAFLYQVRGLNEIKAAAFNERLSSGAELQRDDPELRLRSVLAKLTDSRNLVWHYSLYVKTWNLRQQGRKTKNLALRLDEAMQRPIVAK